MLLLYIVKTLKIKNYAQMEFLSGKIIYKIKLIKYSTTKLPNFNQFSFK